jgi:hypothetical protein
MQAFVSSLTAALLFIHTVFGCCWHHAHGCQLGAAVAVTSGAKCGHQHQHDGDGPHDEKPCGCKIECQGSCIYVVPQKVTVQAPEWVGIDLVAVLPSLAEHGMGTAASWEAGWSAPDLAPPLRRHLLHQVLLN